MSSPNKFCATTHTGKFMYNLSTCRIRATEYKNFQERIGSVFLLGHLIKYRTKKKTSFKFSNSAKTTQPNKAKQRGEKTPKQCKEERYVKKVHNFKGICITSTGLFYQCFCWDRHLSVHLNKNAKGKEGKQKNQNMKISFKCNKDKLMGMSQDIQMSAYWKEKI